MDYIKYYDEIVLHRQSCRNFSDKKVEQNVISDIEAYYTSCKPLVEDVATELVFIDGERAPMLGASVGYNGFIIKAPQYFVILSETKEHYLENVGFVAQGITLKLTQLGIDACWLTINDAAFAKKALKLDSEKEVAAVVAFGYKNKEVKDIRLDIASPSNVNMRKSGLKPAPKISLSDLLYHKSYGAEFDKSNLYSDLEYGLRAVSEAQSFFNRQPYRIIVDDAFISLIGIQDDMTSDSDMLLNFGIAMFNFYAVMEETRSEAPTWSFESPNVDLKLPENAFFVAMCKI